MSKTKQEIFNELITIKEAIPALSGATSSSLTSIWGNFLDATAQGISIFEQLYDQFLVDSRHIRDSQPVNSLSWFKYEMLNTFQYINGDDSVSNLLIDDNFVTYYATEDESAKIVDFCSASQNIDNRIVTIKLAKSDGAGLPIKLANDELDAAKTFISKKSGAGLRISTISLPADQIKFNMDIYYNSNSDVVVKQKVIDAITDYLNNDITFDGQVKLLYLVDKIQQSVPELTDLEIKEAYNTEDGGNPTLFTRSATLKSGYAVLDVANSNFNMIISN
jgi:hypothetical protein